MNIAPARVTDEGGAVRVHIDPKDKGFEFPRELGVEQ